MPKPVVAMVAGYCVGGGHVLHMVCDITVRSLLLLPVLPVILVVAHPMLIVGQMLSMIPYITLLSPEAPITFSLVNASV